MRRVKAILLTVFALGMISTVTIFDPQTITDHILIPIFGKPEPIHEPPPPPPNPRLEMALASIGQEQLREHVEALSAMGSRVPGYAGNRQAYEYIHEAFETIGLADITTESFPVVVPIDKGGHIELPDGERLGLAGLWPNDVRTPSLPRDGVTGHLIYAGLGDFVDFNGYEMEDAIVLMDFDSGKNFLKARMLGAAAVIFFDNGNVTMKQAEKKFMAVPADVPRFWIEKADAQRLIALTERGPLFPVTVEARMDWEEVETWNVYGWIRGEDTDMPRATEKQIPVKWKDQIVVLEGYYDAISVVPAVAPGAESATGIAALLEAARVLKEYGTRYTFLVMATSGHFEGLEGINDFLYRHSRKSNHFLEKMDPAELIDFRVFIGFDLSTANHRVAGMGLGTFYNPAWTTDNYKKNLLAPYSKKLAQYARDAFPDDADPLRGRYIEAIAPAKRTWKDFMPVPLALNSESVTFMGNHGITLISPDDIRPRIDTPSDLPEYVNFDNLTTQTRTITAALYKAARDHKFFPDSKLRLRDWAHDLSGKILWFNQERSFTPEDPIGGAIVTYRLPILETCAGVRRLMTTMTTSEGADKGTFRFRSLRQKEGQLKVQAYKLDVDGRITYAPDLGWDGDKTYPMLVSNNLWEIEMLEILFRCRAITLLDIVDSRYLSALDYVRVLGEDDSDPQFHGYTLIERQATAERDITEGAVIFARPEQRVKILMSTGVLSEIKYLLTNAPWEMLESPVTEAEADRPETMERAEGTGYDPRDAILFNPAYVVAKDMWVIDDVRMKKMLKYGVVNKKIQQLHEKAKVALESARGHLANRQYDAFIASVREAWGLEARAYPDFKSTANDTVNGVIFYFALLLPFSFFLERLLFGFTNITKQILGFGGIFVVVFMILKYVHPAFKLSTSPYIIFLAFVILALGTTILIIIMGKFNQEIRKVKSQEVGVQDQDVGRLSATAAAVALGINNLRKRKIRTGLTAATLILLTFTALSFTSITQKIRFYKLPRGNDPAYQGALVRDRAWRVMQQPVVDYLESAFGDVASVVPRAWFMSKIKSESIFIGFESLETDKASFANGILGLSSREPEITGIDEMLVGSKSRWFRPDDRLAIILPTNLAEIVGVGLEDVGSAKIRMLGSDYTVVGLIDVEQLNAFRDMDDEKITPVDTKAESTRMTEAAQDDPELVASQPVESFQHLEANNVIIVPFEQVRDIGGTLTSVALANFTDESGKLKSDFVRDIEAFMQRVALTMFVGQGDKVKVYSSIGGTSFGGVSNVIIPIVIAALIVLNTMMGSVYERFREIGIYSSVGLAPSHIAALFMAEASVFATVGAVVGYLIGQIITTTLYSGGYLGGLSLNYSSLSAIYSTLVVMATVFLSTWYPAKKASDMAVPDVARKWEMPEPEGDTWIFDFPFTVGGVEVVPMYVYLARVFESYREGSVGDFVTEGTNLEAIRENGQIHYRISLRCWLAPYDLGISQAVSLDAIPTGHHNIYRVEVAINRLSGDVASWKRINRGFLNVLRKRFLVWRTVPAGQKQQYAEEGQQVLGEAPAAS